MTQKSSMDTKECVGMMRAPLIIAGVEVRLAEPSVARMDAINELLGFDIWENNPSTDPRVRKLLMVRFDGNNGKVREFCGQTLQVFPDELDSDVVTGLELGALLQGFFIYYHLRAGTIALQQKLTLPLMELDALPNVMPPKSKKSSRKLKTRHSEC